MRIFTVLLASYIVAVAGVFALVEGVRLHRHLDDRRADVRSIPVEIHPIAAALDIDISRDFLLEARALLPMRATYAVVTGPNVAVSSDLVLRAVPAYTQFALLPRKQVAVDEAQWVLCYGCDPKALPARSETVWSGEPGLTIAKVAL